MILPSLRGEPMSPRHIPAAPAADAPPLSELSETQVVERVLPSGRSLVLRAGGAGEDIEIRSAGGDVELRITLTDAGPVVSMRGARVEVESPDVAFRCRTFDVQATGDVRLGSEQAVRIQADEVRAETKQDIHLNGAFIRLNCTAEGEAEAQALLAQMAANVEAARAAGVLEPAHGAPDHTHGEP
jgi:hypothetical protein